MNVRKAGLVGVGALAAMFAVSPLASAVETPSIPEPPDAPASSATAPNPCSFTATGEDASEAADLTEALPGNVVTQLPVGGDTGPTFGECSTFGQHNGQGNGLGNTLDGVELPAPPSVPGLPTVPGGSSAGSGFGGGVL